MGFTKGSGSLLLVTLRHVNKKPTDTVPHGTCHYLPLQIPAEIRCCELLLGTGTVLNIPYKLANLKPSQVRNPYLVRYQTKHA